MANYNLPILTPFENGMTLVSLANELLSASQVGFNVGSRNDPPTCPGMAHTVEHHFCRGASLAAIAAITQRHPERPTPISARWVDRTNRRYFGGSDGPGINVYTQTSHTGHGHHDLFSPRYLRKVFPVVAGTVRDAMHDVRDMRNRDEAILPPQTFKVERAAVYNETAENDELASMDGYRAALKELYAVNPARNHGDSDPTQLLKLKMGTMKQWAQSNYVPANMRVIIIGPSRNVAVRMVRDVGLAAIGDDGRSSWKPTPWTYDHSDDVPVLTEVKRIELTRPGTKMRHVCILWPTETYASSDRLPLEVLVGLLKDRLEHVYREMNTECPGGVYHPSVELDQTSSHGFIELKFSTSGDDDHAQQLIHRTLAVVEDVKADQSDAFTEDVDDGRFYLANSFREQYQFMPGLFADRIMEALANGDDTLVRFNGYCRNMLHVSPDRVHAVAVKYLHTDRFVLSFVRPQILT